MGRHKVLISVIVGSLLALVLICVCHSADLTVDTNTTLPAGTYTYDNVTVNSVLTCTGDISACTGVTIVCQNLTVSSTGRITADSRGYPALGGPGRPDTGVFTLGGAGHGGYGGLGWNGDKGGITYGSIKNPGTFGSGSATSPGGGIITLAVSNELKIDGTISANGGNGGGAGGSVNLRTKTLSGAGQILANGGNGTSYSDGGGGRIAIYYEASTFTGTVMAKKGVSGWTGAGAGTVFIKPSNQPNGDLIMDCGTSSNGYYTPISGAISFDTIYIKNLAHTEIDATGIVAVTNIFSNNPSNVLRCSGKINSNGNIIINENVVLELNGAHTISSMIIKTNGKLSHTANYDTQARYKLNLTVNNDLTVENGASIDISAKGFPAQMGPGSSPTPTVVAYGGSYGGIGGIAESCTQPGSVYGSETEPADIGSGGWYSSGGGAMYLTVWGTLRVDGFILAEGQHHLQRGIGSGGSVWIKSANLTGNSSGKISVKGGVSTQYNYSHGGGGRLAIYYNTNNFKGIYDTGSGGAGATAGTKYVQETNFHLVPRMTSIDNPAYSSPITGRRPSFKWTAPTDQENNFLKFDIEVTSDSTFVLSPAVSISTDISTTGFQYSVDNGLTWTEFPAGGVPSNGNPAVRVRYTVQQDLSAGYWYWRVRAKDSDGNGSWSETGYLPSITGDVVLKISSPDDSSATYSDSVKVEGTIEQSVTQRITVNGVSADLPVTNNAFSTDVSLEIGKNTISVIATGQLGNSISDTITVYRLKIPEQTAQSKIGEEGGTVRLEDWDEDRENDSRIEIEKGTFKRETNVKITRIQGDAYPAYEITADNMTSAKLAKRVKIVLSYRDMNVKTDDEERLRIFYWDNVKWHIIGSEVNKSKRTVSCYTDHFSRYAVMLVPELTAVNVTIAPVVFTPNNDGINDMAVFNFTVQEGGKAEIRIYDCAGKIVRIIIEENFGNGISLSWDGKDSGNNLLETGVYLFSVSLSGKTVRSGTIAIAK